MVGKCLATSTASAETAIAFPCRKVTRSGLLVSAPYKAVCMLIDCPPAAGIVRAEESPPAGAGKGSTPGLIGTFMSLGVACTRRSGASLFGCPLATLVVTGECLSARGGNGTAHGPIGPLLSPGVTGAPWGGALRDASLVAELSNKAEPGARPVGLGQSCFWP